MAFASLADELAEAGELTGNSSASGSPSLAGGFGLAVDDESGADAGVISDDPPPGISPTTPPRRPGSRATPFASPAATGLPRFTPSPARAHRGRVAKSSTSSYHTAQAQLDDSDFPDDFEPETSYGSRSSEEVQEEVLETPRDDVSVAFPADLQAPEAKLEQDPMVLLDDSLALSSRLLVALQRLDPAGKPRPRDSSPTSCRSSSPKAAVSALRERLDRERWDLEAALARHLEKLTDAERRRDEQMRGLDAIGRALAGVSLGGGMDGHSASTGGMEVWISRQNPSGPDVERAGTSGIDPLEEEEEEEEEGQHEDEIGWIGEDSVGPGATTSATATAAVKTATIRQPRTSIPSPSHIESSPPGDLSFETNSDGAGGPLRNLDPHSELDALLTPTIGTTDHFGHELQTSPQVTSTPFPMPSARSHLPLLPRTVREHVLDPLPQTLRALSESLHASSSHSNSIARSLRGVSAAAQTFREREEAEENARKLIERWEAGRVERGLRGRGGAEEVLAREVQGFKETVEKAGRRIEEVLRVGFGRGPEGCGRGLADCDLRASTGKSWRGRPDAYSFKLS